MTRQRMRNKLRLALRTTYKKDDALKRVGKFHITVGAQAFQVDRQFRFHHDVGCMAMQFGMIALQPQQ
jgi:hypothetical protein